MKRYAWLCLLAALGCEGPNVDLSTQSFDGGGIGASADLAVGGDGGTGGNGSDPLPPGASPEVGPYADFVTARAHSYCTWLSRCGVVAGADEAGCETAETASVASAPPPYSVDDGITAGRAALDAAAAKACTDALDAAGCSAGDVDAVKAACLSVVTGRVKTGLGCRADFECAAGWCANIALGCGSVCSPFATAGFDCTATPCDRSSYCDPLSSHCVADGVSGGECEVARPCAAGLVCRGLLPRSAGSTGKCGAVAKSGEACATSDECALGLYCASATLKCAARIADGMQCTDIDACGAGKSCVGLAYPQGTSVGKPGTCGAFLDAGAACDPAADDSGCALDTACGKTSKTCDAIGTAGSPCPASGCRDGLYCDDHSLCQPLIAYGAGCAPGVSAAHAGCRFGACDPDARACLTHCP
ncbi:MAG: hypothetical protein JWM53_5471 [bacterium]|nr:hypothetical protein [bacterium]